MINAIYGKKIGMTQLFNDKDEVVAVTGQPCGGTEAG